MTYSKVQWHIFLLLQERIKLLKNILNFWIIWSLGVTRYGTDLDDYILNTCVALLVLLQNYPQEIQNNLKNNQLVNGVQSELLLLNFYTNQYIEWYCQWEATCYHRQTTCKEILRSCLRSQGFCLHTPTPFIDLWLAFLECSSCILWPHVVQYTCSLWEWLHLVPRHPDQNHHV